MTAAAAAALLIVLAAAAASAEQAADRAHRSPVQNEPDVDDYYRAGLAGSGHPKELM
jgi:soluble cytochrome b562